MAVKVCNSCGEDNKENAIICVSCNKSLQNAIIKGTLELDKDQNTLKSNSIKFCSKCNEKLEDGALKCRYCGTPTIKVKYSPSAQQLYAGRGKSYFLLYLVTFIIPIVGLIVGGIFSFDNDPEKSAAGNGILIFGIILIVIEAIIVSIVISNSSS